MKLAALQMSSTPSAPENLGVMLAAMREAAASGVELICFPETCNFMTNRRAALREARVQAEDETLAAVCAEAKNLDLWVQAGSFVFKHETQADKLVNRATLINPQGEVVAVYDKIHMFDVELASGERHQESSAYAAGDKAVLAQMGKYKLGLTICYDVRFPSLYNMLAGGGADIICVPAAFTVPTGEAHWHTLLRARAIETGCFIIAAAQFGAHQIGANERQTFGHSLIISPWGEVLAEKKTGEGLLTASVDMGEVAAARRQVPSLLHNREFGFSNK